jgi:hypothetical protein
MAQHSGAPISCALDLVVVVPASEFSAALDDLTSGTSVATVGPSGDLESECITAALDDRPGGRRRPVFVVASTTTILHTAPLVVALRSRLAIDHVPVALADPNCDIDILWGHIFEAGMPANPPGPISNEPPLATMVTMTTRAHTAVAPLQVVREGRDALAIWLALDAANNVAFTFIDGTGRADLAAIAAAIARRPLTVGTPTLLRELLRLQTAAHSITS